MRESPFSLAKTGESAYYRGVQLSFKIITMSLIDTYKTEQDRLEKEEKKKAGIPEEPEDTLTVKEILNNKEDSALFGDMLEHDGGSTNKDLMARLVSGKMEAADIEELSKFRGQFSEKMRAAESVRGELTPELAQEIAKNNPDIQKMIGLVGPEGIVKAVQETIKKMAVTDPEQFKKISKSVETMKSFRDGDLKKLDDSVKEKCKKEGINADEFMKALAIEDGGDRMKALNDLVKKQWDKNGWGKLKRAVDWLTTGALSSGKVNRLEDSKIDIDTAFAELAKYKKEIGSVLGASINGNKDLIEALNREMVGEPKKKETVSMNDAKKDIPTEDSLREGFKKFRKNLGNWDSLDEKSKDSWRDKFLKEEKDKADKNISARGGGFWASIFGAMFNSMFTGFDKKSLN